MSCYSRFFETNCNISYIQIFPILNVKNIFSATKFQNNSTLTDKLHCIWALLSMTVSLFFNNFIDRIFPFPSIFIKAYCHLLLFLLFFLLYFQGFFGISFTLVVWSHTIKNFSIHTNWVYGGKKKQQSYKWGKSVRIIHFLLASDIYFNMGIYKLLSLVTDQLSHGAPYPDKNGLLLLYTLYSGAPV